VLAIAPARRQRPQRPDVRCAAGETVADLPAGKAADGKLQRLNRAARKESLQRLLTMEGPRCRKVRREQAATGSTGNGALKRKGRRAGMVCSPGLDAEGLPHCEPAFTALRWGKSNLVARTGDLIAFVEVKARHRSGHQASTQ